MKYWLAKSGPKKYSRDDFVSEGRDYWDGVRNYQARNNLSAMKIGDRVPVETLTRPVTLADIKAESALAEVALVEQSRLSGPPLLASEYRKMLSLAKP